MKNVSKPIMCDTKDEKNIEAFFTEYETYCKISGYNDDKVRVRSFSYFFKDEVWQGSGGDNLSLKDLKDWAIEA